MDYISRYVWEAKEEKVLEKRCSLKRGFVGRVLFLFFSSAPTLYTFALFNSLKFNGTIEMTPVRFWFCPFYYKADINSQRVWFQQYSEVKHLWHDSLSIYISQRRSNIFSQDQFFLTCYLWYSQYDFVH